MSLTVADLVTELDKNIRDTTTDSVTAAERRQALTEATVWLIENTTNDHTIETYNLDYIDGIHDYKISSSLADFLEPADLRRLEDEQSMPATRKSSREMAEDIANESPEFAFGIERKDSAAYLKINLQGKYTRQQIAGFDSVTADGGTWAADTVNSDALNVTVDTNEYTAGGASINFDVDVSQSGNNRATISGAINTQDLTDFDDIGVLTLDVYIPDATYTSSVTLYWGNSDSVYFSRAQTTDANGNAIANGWNTFKFDWSLATETGTVDPAAIDYIRVDINYTASQTDDTSYRLDNLNIAHPERLIFYYLSQAVGTNSGGTKLYAFTATTDIPYFSGVYEHYKFPVCHKAASILFQNLGLSTDSKSELALATEGLAAKVKLFPSSLVKEDRAFKVKQVSFKRRKFG